MRVVEIASVSDAQGAELGRVALTIGSFDGVHLGHRAILDRLARAAREHDAERAVITFDPHPREFFKPESAPPLLTTLDERARLLSEAGIGALVRLRFDAETADTSAEDFVSRVLLSMGEIVAIVVGYDFRFGKGRSGDAALLARLGARHGFEFAEVEAAAVGETVVKSTAIREAVASGDLDRARALLGRPYFMSGEVVHGAGRGREIGFSTANVALSQSRKLLPPDGVYAVRVTRESSAAAPSSPGVANLGKRPTFGGGARLLEAHLLDGGRDLYGERIVVEFIARLREERAFESQSALAAQIGEDVVRARTILGA
ncbi:MAG: bifunctional riboflavin kinase/FAD synthetase [bacterium]